MNTVLGMLDRWMSQDIARTNAAQACVRLMHDRRQRHDDLWQRCGDRDEQAADECFAKPGLPGQLRAQLRQPQCGGDDCHGGDAVVDDC